MTPEEKEELDRLQREIYKDHKALVEREKRYLKMKDAIEERDRDKFPERLDGCMKMMYWIMVLTFLLLFYIAYQKGTFP